MTIRLYVDAPATVLVARVNMPGTVIYPRDELVYDGVTVGSASNVRDGMTVLFGSAPGLDNYGKQRIRKLPSAGNLYIGRFSQGIHDGEVDVVDNAYITVLREFRVWAKIPYINSSGEEYKDSDISADTAAYYPPPCANAGSARAGTVNASNGLLRVAFDGHNSFQFDATVSTSTSGASTFQWSFSAGTVVAGAVNTAYVTVDFPPGLHYAYLLVSNVAGFSHQATVPILARNPASDICIQNFQLLNRKITPQGTEVQVRIMQALPRSTYPDGGLVILWDDEPFGPTDNSNLVFVGWHQRDDESTAMQETANIRDTTLTCIDVLGRLKTLPGFSQRVEAAELTSDWYYTRFPNLFYYLWFILNWHSTGLDVADLLRGDHFLNHFEFVVWASDAGNLYEQVNKLANQATPDHYLTVTRPGQMWLVADPIVQNTANRTNVVQQNLDNDWIDVKYAAQRAPRVHWHSVTALKAQSFYIDVGGNQTLEVFACIAPGNSPGQGEAESSDSERIVSTQEDLNICEGNRYARLNAPYGMTTVTVPLSSLSKNVDPGLMQWLNFSMDVGHAGYRQGAPSGRFLAHEINITYEYSDTAVIGTATITMELETSGRPALTIAP